LVPFDMRDLSGLCDNSAPFSIAWLRGPVLGIWLLHSRAHPLEGTEVRKAQPLHPGAFLAETGRLPQALGIRLADLAERHAGLGWQAH
jgi:hypothetical protein